MYVASTQLLKSVLSVAGRMKTESTGACSEADESSKVQEALRRVMGPRIRDEDLCVIEQLLNSTFGASAENGDSIDRALKSAIENVRYDKSSW